MNIKDLVSGQGNVEITATVKEIEEEPKTINKFGRDIRLQNIIIEDDSGAIKLTLWNDDAGRFKVGDKIKLTNGYVKEFKDEKQLTTGKFGKITHAGKGDAKIPTDSSSTMEKPEEAAGISNTSNPDVEEEEVAEEIEEGLI